MASDNRLTTQLLEPHEGVRGVARDSDPILESVAASKLVANLGRHLYSATLVGNQAPKVTRLDARMHAPEVGDVIVVLDATYSSDPDTIWKSVGYLVARREEWATTREVWDQEKLEDPDANRWVEHEAWYIQYGPAPEDICRWTNCSVIAVPNADDGWI